MKHLFTMLLALIAATASAQDFMVDGICYNILSEDDRTVEVTESPYGYAGEVVIPAEVTYDGRTYSVTTIGEDAFYDCGDLVSVDMPSVTAIGDRAFASCNALTSVSMPSVTAIGEKAFYWCSALTSVSMPEVTTIGGGAFNNCYALYSVTMPSVTTIGVGAFIGCTALTSVDMPEVTTIGNSAFGYCSALTSVSMPSVTAIGEQAFHCCFALTSVDIPASCTSIAGNPFQGCESLEEIVVDENNPNYSSMDGVLYDKYMSTLIAFPGKKSSIDMSSSVTTIGDWAFGGCSALTSVSMPSVTTIGDEAFNYCDALTSVSMPSVTTIGEYAFNDCSALTSVDIPASCTSIGSYLFAGCTALKEIVVDDNNPNYSSADGVLYDKGKTTLLSWPTAEGGINLPLSVTKIGVGAFISCYSLTSVSMPSVTTIGDWAFGYCFALTSVDMSEVTTIGNSAFGGCRALASVSMPVATTIGDHAFEYCYALTSVSMPSVTTIGDYAFRECSALTSASMPEVTTIGDYAFRECSALTSVSMPEVTTIGYGAFYYCSALTSIDIPASVTTLGISAFGDCNGLTSVYCHWEDPLKCDPRFENTVLETAILYVPTGTIDAYRSVDPWRWFINIEEGNYSGIADTPGSGLSVKVIDGVITVEGGDMAVSAPVVEVYSAGGQCVYRGTDSSIGGLGHGVYVVKAGGTVQKVAL